MLIIRESQLRSLREPFIPEVVAELAKHAHECHSAEANALGDGLDAYLRDVVERGGDYGLTSVRDLSRYLSLVLIVGPDWQTPELQWMHDALVGPTIGASRRLRMLFNRALDRLAAAEAHDAESVDA